MGTIVEYVALPGFDTNAGETMAIDTRENDRPTGAAEKTAVEARQGVISGRVFLVLVVSLFLAIVALGIGYWAVH